MITAMLVNGVDVRFIQEIHTAMHLGCGVSGGAQRYTHLLINGIHRLERQPLLGHPVEYAPEPESIRDLIVGDYLLRYAVFSNQIMILRVWYQRESWKQK